MADQKPDEETAKFSALPKSSLGVDADSHTIKMPRYLCPKHGVIEFAIVSNIKGKPGAWCQICHVDWLDENITKVQPVTEKPAKPK